jgi:hypothetical protein
MTIRFSEELFRMLSDDLLISVPFFVARSAQRTDYQQMAHLDREVIFAML